MGVRRLSTVVSCLDIPIIISRIVLHSTKETWDTDGS